MSKLTNISAAMIMGLGASTAFAQEKVMIGEQKSIDH